VSPERWDLELRTAGFTGINALAYDNELPYQVTATMLSSISQPAPEKKRVTILYHKKVTEAIESYKRSFEKSGHSVDLHALGDDLPSNQDIISLLELETPFFHGIERQDFEQWSKIASGIETTNLLWLTRSSSIGTKDPRYAEILGFARTLRSEKQTSFTTLEIDDIAHPSSPEQAVQIYEQIGRSDNDPELDPDYEFALSKGTIYSSRFHWVSVRDELAIAAKVPVNKVLRIGQRGMIDSLRWEENKDASRPLQGIDVAIRPHTVGVNFRVSYSPPPLPTI
jgi:hypothetical protein